MRMVIENGKQFSHENFFMMLKELNPLHIDTFAARFLRILVSELDISAHDVELFIRSLTSSDPYLRASYNQT